MGTITNFAVAGSGATNVQVLNSSGPVAGYFTAKGQHGFIRDALGNITTFDFSGSTSTEVYALNDSGEVAWAFALATRWCVRRSLGTSQDMTTAAKQHRSD